MGGVTFDGILTTVREKAKKINANVSLENPSLNVLQVDPWNVKISLTADFIVEDVNGLALWNKTEEFVTYIPIESFNDPIYLINTNGLVSVKLKKSPHSVFVSDGDASNLNSHLDNSYYIASASGPSFLDRLQGSFSANQFGVESLVNLEKLTEQDISVKDKSLVDYIYFSSENPNSCDIEQNGLPSWFKLDRNHLNVYNVSC